MYQWFEFTKEDESKIFMADQLILEAKTTVYKIVTIILLLSEKYCFIFQYY